MASSRSRILSIILLQLVALATNAQIHERDHWYFGVRAGLKFSNNSVTVVNDGQTSEVNATAVMSDSNGNLLFYTDGNKIWNRQHQVMANGDGIDGYDGNYAQQVVVVRHPGDPNRYYIFYTSEHNYPTHLHRLKYSIVNISTGDGIVESKNVLLPTEDILIKIAAVEKIGEQFWVVTQGDKTGKYFAFKGSRAGLDATPVVTDVGVSTFPTHSIDYGDLRFSPNGKILAAANTWSNRLSLFKFDFNTGVLNEPIFVPTNMPASIEFAPAGQLFYLTTLGNCGSNTLYQCDISTYTESAIKSSFMNIGSAYHIGMLQRGPNNVIYVGRRNPSDCNFYSYIGTIGFPDVRGVGAQFKPQAIHLETGTTFQGLPNFSTILCDDYTSLPASVSLCNEPSFTIDLSGSTAQLHWENGSTSPMREVTKTGVYTVESTVGSCKEFDSSTITFNNDTIGFRTDSIFTFNFPVLLMPVSQMQPSSISMVWQDNTTTRTYQANEAGIYSFTASLDGCVHQDTITVIHRELFVPNVITTNNDGKNDFFVLPFIRSDERWEVRIYNRYGVEIFSDPNYRNNWKIDHKQVCYYRIINKKFGIDFKGLLHVLN